MGFKWVKSNKKKKKGLFSKALISFIIIANVAFTIAILFIFNHTGSEPSTLIASWFAFTTGELFTLASIKKKKINSNYEGGTEQ